MKNKKQTETNSLLKLIPIIYGIMFIIVIFLLLFISGVTYHLKRNYFISNLLVIIPFSIILFLFYKFYKDKKIEKKKFRIFLIILFAVVAILQIVLITHTYFYTDWDVKVIREIVNNYIKEGSIKDNFYLSIYPNNILLTAILAFIKKLPFIGKYYLTTLIFNAGIVNISGILTALTIKNLKNEKLALLSYIIMIPLILLSPWINIPYSDTFALPFITAIMYIYSKQNKKLIDYSLIGFLSFLGYKIKPTVIIILIAIIIVEVISNIKKLNKTYIKEKIKPIGVFIIGIVCAFLSVKVATMYLNFKPLSYAKSISFIHYLAMGQNNETLGSYSQQDVDDTINLGTRQDITKFKERVLGRTPIETLDFYSKKTLLNFNDGSFCWGLDGTFFYKKVKAPNSFAKFLRQIYYNDGKYFDTFIQIQNILWLIVLFFAPFIIKKKNTKQELVIMLSIIGLVLFLTIFEPRTRYMYCYSEIYVIAAMLGLYNLSELIRKHKTQ